MFRLAREVYPALDAGLARCLRHRWRVWEENILRIVDKEERFII